ncbi:Crp/Fnr family transcriptional regulator [uncultured Anaerococcus sp.]|uniref:Crp/Fnr family transcriptional regulator n=1 Tax=uncultured Anaerococcus sp. TaxID=293428 RepID=UPI0026375791|nr:Crp/Fnr family transcriptional regulator [uncultured Anaerococcus sp.]
MPDILKFKLFDNISNESIDKLSNLSVNSKSYQANEVVLRRNDDLEYALLIDKGCLKACEYTINGKEIVSSYYFKGDAFPFYLYFGGTKTFPYDIYAVKRSLVYFLPLKEFEMIMDEDIILTKNILKFIAEYTTFNKLVIRATQYSKVIERLSYWIVHLDEVDYLKLPTSQAMLANILRVNRSSLNQELKYLRDNNIIKLEGMDIEIIDREYLLRVIN